VTGQNFMKTEDRQPCLSRQAGSLPAEIIWQIIIL
jgi:hypothetical protein